MAFWFAYVLITGAELFGAAADWGFRSTLSDPNHLGAYQGVWQFGNQVSWIVGPALITWLVMNSAASWFAIAIVVTLAAALTVPAARLAERNLRQSQPENDLAQPAEA